MMRNTMIPLLASSENKRSFLKNVWLMRFAFAVRGLVGKSYWARSVGEFRSLMSYRFKLSALVAVLVKTPAARLRARSRPTPIMPEGKFAAASTFADEIRFPPRLSAGSKLVLKSAPPAAFCQIALFTESNSKLRPTVSAKFVVVNQRAEKFVMNALVGERIAAKPLVPAVLPKNVMSKS